MTVTKGVNCGFVSTAPTADPTGSNFVGDAKSSYIVDTSPSDAVKITEIGWYCDNATEETNFEVGLYADSSGAPTTRLFVDNTNAKGTGAGWKTVSVDWSISGSTTYWIAVQVDDTATPTNINYSSAGGDSYLITGTGGADTSLINPETGTPNSDFTLGIYAVYEASSGTNTQINIGDAWKEIAGVKINIGDAWKEVSGMQINIGDSWKTIF